VLVIDDDESIAQEICETLSLRNFSGSYAENISAARNSLAKDNELGIVIVDFNMPEMNGIEVIRALKKETQRALAFIMLTGDDTQSTAINAVKAQAFDFLRKPVEPTTITDAVKRAFEHLTQVTDEHNRNEALKVESQALKQRLESISGMLRHRENLLQRLLLSDRSAIDAGDRKNGGGRADGDTEAHVSAKEMESAPLECMPVNVSALMNRMTPAISKMCDQNRVELKTRVPNNLPFLYGDEKRLSRALADLAVVLISELSSDDRLKIMAIREGRDLVISFRVQSRAIAESVWRVFTLELTRVIDEVDQIDLSEMKLVGARIVTHLHGGRAEIGRNGDTEWFLRMFFPLPAVEMTH